MKFTTYGRILAALGAIGLTALAAYQQIVNAPKTFIGLSVYEMIMGVVVAIVEFPGFCSCSVYSVAFAKYTRAITGFWVSRAMVHIAVAGGACAIYAASSPDTQNSILLICPIMLFCSAVLYLLGGLWKREENPGGLSGETSSSRGAAPPPAGATAPPAPGGFAAFFTRSVVKAAVANPELAASVAVAAAPTAAQLAFGGAGASKSSYSLGGVTEERRGSPTQAGEGAKGDSPPAPEKPSTSMFTGGSLFGGNSKAAKYGVSDEVDGSNPFLS